MEIRWGNCEKMAGVLASGGGGSRCSAKRERKKTIGKLKDLVYVD